MGHESATLEKYRDRPALNLRISHTRYTCVAYGDQIFKLRKRTLMQFESLRVVEKKLLRK